MRHLQQSHSRPPDWDSRRRLLPMGGGNGSGRGTLRRPARMPPPKRGCNTSRAWLVREGVRLHEHG
eukprot:7958235-Heterocapsa_arctica.AAC.1